MSDEPEILTCPCLGETKLFYEKDEDGEGYYYVQCLKCKAHSSCYIGSLAEYSAVNEWNNHVETGYVPHAGKKQPIEV